MSATLDAESSVAAATVDQPVERTASALRLETVALALSAAAIVIGMAVLLGYTIGNEGIVRLSPSLPPMYPNAAIGLVCGGVAIVGSRGHRAMRAVAGASALVLLGIGVVGLVLNLQKAGPTWFEYLFDEDVVASTTPVGGRPVAETCVAFIFLGIACVLLVTRRWPLLAQASAAAGASVGTAAVVGYVLGVDRSSLGAGLVYVGMALHTGLGIAIVGIAAVLVKPYVGFTAQLLEGGASGALIRRLTLGVAAVPVALVVIGATISALLPTDDLAQSVFSVVQVGVLGCAVLVPAALITRTERQLRQELDSVRRRQEHRGDVDTVVQKITGEMRVVVPEIPGWETGMRYRPATGHLAGDSVQVHERDLPEPATLVAVLDIAGHDAYSAVVAYGLRAHIGALWEHGATLAEIAESLNEKVVQRQTIATGVLMTVTHRTDTVEVVNAGHPPPIHVQSGRVTTWERTGPLLGLEGATHVARSVEIGRGDVIAVITDGLIEVRSAAGDQLDERLLHRVLTSREHESADAIADACVNLALQHADSRLRDDALVIVARKQ
jgi:serine phosphatase RsbU (regulator of sigma subunit)